MSVFESSNIRNLRRLSQGLNLLLWFTLFTRVFHHLLAAVPPDLYLSLDPLTGIGAALASRSWVPSMALGLLTLLVTGVLGRVFCGWICPLGVLIDIVGALGVALRRVPRLGAWWTKRLKARKRALAALRRAGAVVEKGAGRWRFVKVAILLLVLAAAPFGLELAWLLDPIPLLTRAAALLGFPVVARPVAPPPPGMFPAGLSAVILGLVVLLPSLVVPRFWCRYLCPLGGLLSLVSRFSLFKMVTDGCTGCGHCMADCPMGIRELPMASRGKVEGPSTPDDDVECIRCYNCTSACPVTDPGLAVSPGLEAPQGTSLERRAAIAAMTAGAAMGALDVMASPGGGKGPRALPPMRPPHAAPEERFQDLCVRCNACVRACPTGTLRAFFLERGPTNLWTPEMVPSLGGCTPDCTACSDACPTGAIGPFTPQTKYDVKAGTVRFRIMYCIAYGPGARECGKCVEVCPTDAFVVRRSHEGGVRPRRVIPDRCVGCGLCEYACTIETRGMPAMIVTAEGRGEPTRL